MIRKVISGTPKKRIELAVYLQGLFKKKKIVYGLHFSDSALMTCIVSNYEKDRFHFIDGKSGG